MNNLRAAIWMTLGLVAYRAGAASLVFDSGSDGTGGALNVTENRTLQIPPDGRFQFTTINVTASATLTFARNALNTPVYLLASGDVTIAGTIDASANDAVSSLPTGGLGGPGGFDGGVPGVDSSKIPPGDGFGPGAGKSGSNSGQVDGAGSGGYGTAGGSAGSSTNHGALYGTPLLIPLIGGSGGGGSTGNPGNGGGGGGGAILVASSTRIVTSGTTRILARGGSYAGSAYNSGSGGAIRLVAPVVLGNGQLNVTSKSAGGGQGRIRIDTLDRSGLQLQYIPVAAATLGSAMVVFPNPVPRLDIIEAAGTAIPEGTPNPVVVALPFGSAPQRTIKVQARDFIGKVPVDVVLTPESGRRIVYQGEIDMAAGNPAAAAFDVVFPVNTRTSVNVWTR